MCVEDMEQCLGQSSIFQVFPVIIMCQTQCQALEILWLTKHKIPAPIDLCIL